MRRLASILLGMVQGAVLAALVLALVFWLAS